MLLVIQLVRALTWMLTGNTGQLRVSECQGYILQGHRMSEQLG